MSHDYQPHAPFVGVERLRLNDASDLDVSDNERPLKKNIGESARWGDLLLERLNELYPANLEWGVTEALRLIENAPHSHVAITADHGEALGEWMVVRTPAS